MYYPDINLCPYISHITIYYYISTVVETMVSGPNTPWQIDGETMETVTDFIFGAPKSLQMVTAAMKLKDTCSLEEKL